VGRAPGGNGKDMIATAKNLITTAVRRVTGSSAARSDAAAKAAATRQRNARARSAAAKRAAQTRRQRDDRVDAMVEATRRD
jgi:hypothetical protein